MVTFQLTFVNYSTKDVFNINVESIITDAYIYEQGYLEMINTDFPNIEWLTLLAEKKAKQETKFIQLKQCNKIKLLTKK